MGPPGLVILLLVVLVASPGPVIAQSPTSDRASVYRRPLGNDPATLDPARISDIYGLSVAQQIFDGLVEFDQALRIVPAIAQYWKASRDGLTWTFTLRKGVKFHDGRAVTADDVVYSLTRLLDPKVKSAAADVFVSVQGAAAFREGRAATGERVHRDRPVDGARRPRRGAGAAGVHAGHRVREDRAA